MLLIIEPLKVFVLLSLRWLLRSCSLIDSSLGQDTMIILMDWESTKQISEHHAANRDSKKIDTEIKIKILSGCKVFFIMFSVRFRLSSLVSRVCDRLVPSGALMWKNRVVRIEEFPHHKLVQQLN